MNNRSTHPTEKAFAALSVAAFAALMLLASCATSARSAKSAGSPTAAAPVAASPTTATPGTDGSGNLVIDSSAPPAPPFPTGLAWLNTAAPLTLKALRGKFVLIDFWTYGCINCIHDIPWIKKLEADFPNSLAVVGVHSAKFSHSGITKNIRETILRFKLNYPVVNDSHFQIWQEYGVQAWPTTALLDPQGRVVGWHVGEGFYPSFKATIARLKPQFAAAGLLDERPLKLKLEKQGLPQTVLAFPGKVRVDAAENRMFIADTGHNRIVEARLDSGQVIAVIGNGAQGLVDGSYAQAEFNQPEGMAYSSNGKFLYVADTGNHDLRLVNLVTHRVSTLDGTGQQAASYPPTPGTAPNVALNSPWDLALSGDILYIAMAGTHQIWTMNLTTKRLQAFAGSGAEGANDGPAAVASLAQPSGLSLAPNGERLYFDNSEGSSVRYIDLATQQVVTLAGPIGSLFDFGNRNGIGEFARFQHPLGIVAYDGVVYVADTYNSEIRAVNPISGAVKTIAGGPGSGWRDGKYPLFYEPSGLDAAHGKLYVADTNNNSIRVIDLKTGVTSTFVLKGLNQLSGAAKVYGIKNVTLPPVSVTPGSGVIELNVTFPKGYEPNAEAPSEIDVSSPTGSVVALTGLRKFSGAGPHFPMRFAAAFSPGTTRLTIDISIVYCQDQEAKVCLIHQAKLDVPVTVSQSGSPATRGSASKTGNPILAINYHVE